MTACGYCGVEIPHRPYARKQDMPSVTSVTSMVDDGKSRSFGWAASLIAATTAVHYPSKWEGLVGQMSDRAVRNGHHECTEEKDGLCKACVFLRSEFDRKWSEKADLGTHVHHLALSWAQGEPVDVDPRTAPYIDALEKFYVDCEPEFHHLESTVLYEKPVSHAYRGQFDFIADVTRGAQRRRGLWDIKTGSYYPIEQTLQLAAYRHAQYLTGWEAGKEKIADAMPFVAEAGVLLLGGDGEYRLIELPANGDAHAVFLRQVDTWRWCKQMRKWEKDNPQGLQPAEELA